MATVSTLHDLLLHELGDLYSAEKQITHALPKMVKAATSPKLKQAFEKHLEQTNEQIKRLEKAFESLDHKPKAVHCKGMEGLLEEGDEAAKTVEPGAVLDAALIGAAQRVEHYEIAGYGVACEHARIMEHDEALELLEETLNEEKETDDILTELAEGGINDEANTMVETD